MWTTEDAEWLGVSGLGGRVTRILVEPGELQLRDSEDKTAEAIERVVDIHQKLDRLGPMVPRLQHGDEDVAWVLLEDAIRKGLPVSNREWYVPDRSDGHTPATVGEGQVRLRRATTTTASWVCVGARRVAIARPLPEQPFP